MPKIKTNLNLTIISILFFFLSTPIIIFLSLHTLLSIHPITSENKERVSLTDTVQIFAALPDSSPVTNIKLISSDARGDILKSYLDKYNSPLSPFSYYIVNVADEFGLDFRLITAIAMQESNLCKFIPENTYNCWGWGIHSRGTLGFNSYEEGIRIVSEGLRNDYLEKGYSNPEDIMKKYTPLSNGSWANGVNQFILEMQ